MPRSCPCPPKLALIYSQLCAGRPWSVPRRLFAGREPPSTAPPNAAWNNRDPRDRFATGALAALSWQGLGALVLWPVGRASTNSRSRRFICSPAGAGPGSNRDHLFTGNRHRLAAAAGAVLDCATHGASWRLACRAPWREAVALGEELTEAGGEGMVSQAPLVRGARHEGLFSPRSMCVAANIYPPLILGRKLTRPGNLRPCLRQRARASAESAISRAARVYTGP